MTHKKRFAGIALPLALIIAGFVFCGSCEKTQVGPRASAIPQGGWKQSPNPNSNENLEKSRGPAESQDAETGNAKTPDGAKTAPAPADAFQPEILIMTPSGWFLTMRQDGSGKFSQRSQGQSTPFPAATLDFSRTLSAFKNNLSAKSGADARFGVAITEKKHASPQTRFSGDTALVAQLFRLAKTAAKNNLAPETEELWKKNPPTPEQQETPK